MKSQNKNLIAGLFGLVLAISFIVAASSTFSVSTNTLTFNPGDDDASFTINNLNSSTLLDVNFNTPTIGSTTFSVSGQTSGINSSSLITLTANNLDFSTIDFLDKATGTLLITNPADSSTESITVELENTEFCSEDNPGELKVKIDDLTNEGLGDDETWYPLDVLTVDVNVENRGDEDVDNIEIEWGLYSVDDDRWVIEVDEEDQIDLKDGDEDTVQFTIDLDKDLDVDLDELDDGDYKLYVRATGEVDNSSAPMTCHSDEDTYEIRVEKDFVVADNMKFIGDNSCGATVQFTADIANIGTKDQDDVVVYLYNKDLKIDEQITVGDIDAFEDKKLNYEFIIPSGIAEKIYSFEVEVFDEDGDIYESDDEASYTLPFTVSGSCSKVAEASVLASLESGGKAGEELKIRATVTNSGSESEIFQVDAGDFSNWAELVSISPASVTLNSGTNSDVIITFNVKDDVKESQTFNLLLTDSNGNTLTQPVGVTIDKAGLFNFGGNSYLWGIALANVILIVLIIVVAVRAMRK